MKESLSVINNNRNFMEPGNKKNITDGILYQDNSIVSKVIIKKPTGNVTVFAFDSGESLSPHSAPFDALVHVIDGKAEIMIGEDFHILESNDMIVMPAGIIHGVKAIDKFKMILTMIKS